MNIMHLRYALAVEKTGSINKAAEMLLIGQPNLSRAIKELESSLGIAIFERSAKGMVVTPEGEEFLGYAKKILAQIDEVEQIYKTGAPAKQRFSVSVPRAGYIAEAFAAFSKSLRPAPAEIYYEETNAGRAMKNILQADYKLGIIRYDMRHDDLFKEKLAEKNLAYEIIAEFPCQLLFAKNSPLAEKTTICHSDLESLIEIAEPDVFVPSLSPAEMKKETIPDDTNRKIFVFERASRFTLLLENNETFFWDTPMPANLLEKYGLLQRPCEDSKRMYRDVLIHREGYRLSKLDNIFITELCNAKRRYFR